MFSECLRHWEIQSTFETAECRCSTMILCHVYGHRSNVPVSSLILENKTGFRQCIPIKWKNEATWCCHEPTCLCLGPNLTLTHVTFDLDPCNLWTLGKISKKWFFSSELLSSDFWSSERQTDGQMDRQNAMHKSPMCISTGGLNEATWPLNKPTCQWPIVLQHTESELTRRIAICRLTYCKDWLEFLTILKTRFSSRFYSLMQKIFERKWTLMVLYYRKIITIKIGRT